MNDLKVVKSNKLIRAGYKLTMNEQRLLLLGISKLDSTRDLDSKNKVTVSAQEFSELYGIHEKTAYREVKKSVKDFAKRYLTLPSPTEKEPNREIIINWMHKTVLNPNAGTVEIYFHDDMAPYISQLKSQFTQYRLQEVAHFKSVYGVRLFEFLMQWKNKTSLAFSVDELRACFQLEEKQYPRFFDFKKRCLIPAIRDVDSHSSFTIEDVAYTRSGKIITHIEFTFCEKGKVSQKKSNKFFDDLSAEFLEDKKKPFSEDSLPLLH